MRKALFFDIDGTLVNFQGEMPEGARHALRCVREKGHKIVICSGRSLFQIYPWLLDMGFDGVIGAAGAYVECDAKVIYEHHMKKEELVAVRSLLERLDASYAAQTKVGTVMTADNKNRMMSGFVNVGLKEEMSSQMWGNIQLDEHLEQRHDIEKLFFFEAQTSVDEIQEQLSHYCDVTAMSFQLSNNSSGEISSRGINKAFGMQVYLEHTEITRENTIAFGDGINDIEMLKYAHVGVAMGNAVDALKKQADYVTSGIDEDGIECALNAFGLL